MRVFAKRSHNFDPAKWPVAAFGNESCCDELIAASSPGDLLVFAGTEDDPTALAERGRLLGIAEFARVPVNVSHLIDTASLGTNDSKRNGVPPLQIGLLIKRAWKFAEPRFKLIDVLKEQLTFQATIRAVQLDGDDTRAVLALPKIEIDVPLLQRATPFLALSDALDVGRPTTGPVPFDWKGEIYRTANFEAWTYAMRFGKRNVWKVGHSQDTVSRLREINLHVPHEEIGERWGLALTRRWSSSVDAFAMEQCILKTLRVFRTEGERILCSEAEILSAWSACSKGCIGLLESDFHSLLLSR